jgi:hypothetical protein
MVALLSFGSLAVLFALYGYAGRFATWKGYRAGESGSMYTLAWPFYMRLAPHFLGLGALLFALAAGVRAAS